MNDRAIRLLKATTASGPAVDGPGRRAMAVGQRLASPPPEPLSQPFRLITILGTP